MMRAAPRSGSQPMGSEGRSGLLTICREMALALPLLVCVKPCILRKMGS
jgi:hypothetical protein